MRRILPLLLAAALLAGCRSAPAAVYEKHQREFYDVFDTVTVVIGYTRSEAEFDRYATVIYDELYRLHQLFDIYNDYAGVNNVRTVNQNAGVAPVAVDGDIIALLELARTAHEESGGAVNVAMGSVLRLWHDARTAALEHPAEAALPDAAALARAAAHMDMANVILDAEAGTVYLADPAMSLDVGAFAKGYAVQRAIDRAREAGLTSGFISAGGNVCVIGQPLDGREMWRVGIQSPTAADDGTRPLFDVVQTADMAVVTSGNYERFFTVEGENYHHIIDPATLLPANRYQSVTVLHPDSGTAELLSTPLFILPYEAGAAMLELYGGEALWIARDGTVETTAGYRALSANYGEEP